MPRSRPTEVAIVASVIILVLGACGGDDSADDGPIERGSGEVDIDGETVRYRSDDGDAVFELDEAGQVRVTGDEGETILTHGDGTVLPEQWPDEFVLPEDMTLTSASTMSLDGQVRVNVTGVVSGETRGVHDDLKTRVVAAGLDLQGESLQDDDAAAFGTISATSDTTQAAVTVTGEGATVTISIFLGLQP